MSKPILWIVIPCYNEEAVLPITAPLFLQKINDLAARGLVSDRSRVLFVNDGSKIRPGSSFRALQSRTSTSSALRRAATAATRMPYWQA